MFADFLPERLLTTDETAAILRLSPKTLEAWRMRGGGPRFVRLRNRMIRYHTDDIETFVVAGRRRSASDLSNG
jgi:Helix-turn-helix domain